MKRSLCMTVVCVLVFFLKGCAGKDVKPDSFPFSEEPPSFKNTTTGFSIQPGDNFNIVFHYNPELNESAVVRPDGRISLQLIDEIEAAGLTPLQLEQRIKERYSPYLKNPEVSLTIQSFGGQRVYVGGQVNSPGVINLKGRTGVVQAILEAGGFRTDANMSDILIISKGTDDSPVARKVDVKKALKSKRPQEETQLRPYDVVYVPKSAIVKANEFIHHVYNFIPPNIWFGFSYELHREPY
jgi:protein involved in polysaccharide export with SLBB domain